MHLPKEHPDFGKHYDQVRGIGVHGGLTFSEEGKFGCDNLASVGRRFGCVVSD